jgi:hypothetical protein
MFKVFRSIALIAAMAFNCGSALAEADMSSANYMMPYCRQWLTTGVGPVIDDVGKGICYGVVITLVSVYQGKDFCVPYDGTPGPTNGQFVRVVVQYIDQRPSRLHENFHNLAHEALRAAWPCKK